ncbi:hypothetical protein VBY74_02115 [Tenacibaculum ascidiaceicola]|uniref:hypothetical protein n=1 Tax=Tenacibaculum ascidiaceicola TaxID=1699411 RepID=UPI0039EC86AB
MKRIYIQFLLILLVSTFNIDLQAQRLNIPEKSTIGDEFLIAPDGTYSDLQPVLAGRCSGCEMPDLDIRDNSSNWSSSFDAAIANENLIRRAAKKKLKEWYNRQVNEIVKPAIDKKFSRTFSSFNEAKNELLIDSERRNIVTFSKPIRDRYRSLKSKGFYIQKKHLKELKLLKLREAEIKSGNINNPAFGYVKVQGVYLKDIKSLNSLKSKWTPLFNDFSKNTAETHINNHIYKSIGRGVEPEVTKLKNQYYNSLNTWDRLSLLQFLIHYEEYKKLSSTPYLPPEHIDNMFKKFNNIDKATPELIENLSIKNRTGGFSVFDYDYQVSVIINQLAPVIGYNQAQGVAVSRTKARMNEELDKLLNSTSTADFAITNLIGELNITNNTQKNWLYEHKTAANKLIKFIDNNKVNNKITDKAKAFALEVSKALANDTNLDIRPYLKSITATPSGTSHQNYDPNDPILGNQILLDIVNNAIDGFGNLILLYLEYKSNNANEGKVLRYLMPKMGLEISDDIPDETLGELFSLRKRDRSLVIEYQNNTIKGLLIEVTVSTLDVVTLISPSKGGGAYLLASGGHRVTAASLSKLLNSLKSRIYTLRGDMIGKTIGHTFKTHGSHLTEMCKLRAINGNKHVGQWLDDAAAENFIARHLNQLKKGTIDVPIPSNIQNIGRVFRKGDGAIITPTHIRLVPSGSGVKTAYPINSSLTDLRTIGVYIP